MRNSYLIRMLLLFRFRPMHNVLHSLLVLLRQHYMLPISRHLANQGQRIRIEFLVQLVLLELLLK